MACTKPPTTKEYAELLVDAFMQEMETSGSVRITSVPYYDKIDQYPNDDCFIFFMLKILRQQYLTVLAYYIELRSEHDKIGTKLLRFFFELEKVIHKHQSIRLLWNKNSVTFYINCFPYTNKDIPNDVKIFQIPIPLTNDTSRFPYKYITMYSNCHYLCLNK